MHPCPRHPPCHQTASPQSHPALHASKLCLQQPAITPGWHVKAALDTKYLLNSDGSITRARFTLRSDLKSMHLMCGVPQVLTLDSQWYLWDSVQSCIAVQCGRSSRLKFGI